MQLDMLDMKINKPQFTHCGCGNLTEYETAKNLVASILDTARHCKLITMKLLTKLIAGTGKDFAEKNTADPVFQEELYNRFVGDFFELFAEYFFKTCSAVGQYGIIDYRPAESTGDWGVDGYGTAADQRESAGGATPAVVQVKFRSNPMDEISYTMLAKTGWDGIKNYGLDVNRKNNIILFCNTENGSNYLAKDALGDNLYVIKKSDLDKDRTGIKTVTFWEGFYRSIP